MSDEMVQVLPDEQEPVETPLAESLSDDELQTAVEKAHAEIQEPLHVVEKVPEPVVEPPKEEKAPEPVVESVKEPKVAEPAKAEQVEQPAVQKTPYEEVQDKLGFKSKEALAQSYMDLNKEFQQKLRDGTPAKAPQPIVQTLPPISNGDDFNAHVQESLQNDPVNTVKALTKVYIDDAMKEERAERQTLKLHSTIDRLSSSPETASFNDPEIQTEMQKIYAEDPSLVPNMTQNMSSVYDQAEGRLARQKRAVVNQNAPKVKPAVVEGANTPAPMQSGVFNKDTATEAELEAEVRRLWDLRRNSQRY